MRVARWVGRGMDRRACKGPILPEFIVGSPVSQVKGKARGGQSDSCKLGADGLKFVGKTPKNI